jgi:hypothetical protein
MDPNANLEEQRRLVKLLLDGSITTDRARSVSAYRLAELVSALDEWISRDGFLPKAWGARVAPPSPNEDPRVLEVLAMGKAGANVCRGVPFCHGSFNGEHVLSCPLFERKTP